MQVVESTYSELLDKNIPLKKHNIAYLTDWSKLSPSVQYYSVIDSKTKDIKGCFMIYKSKNKGFNRISNVPFFQDCGLWVKKEFESNYKQNSLIKNVTKALAEYLNKWKWVNISLPHSVNDTQEFIWNGLDVLPRYSYLLDISRSTDELKKHFGRGLKPSIKKIEEGAFDYSNVLDARCKTLIEESSLTGRGEDEKQFFQKLFTELKELSETQVLKVKENESESVAVFLVHGKTAVYLLGGSDSSSGSVVGTASVYKGIEMLKEMGVELFDFEGSMIPGVEKFFRTFGGELVTIYNIQKTPKVIRIKNSLMG